MSLSSVYRRPALAPPSRKAIAYGTGERLVVHVPMPPSEIVQALSRVVQSDRPKLSEKKTESHRAFYGVLSASGFRLKPLWSNATLLDVQGDIQANESSSVVTIDIRLPIRRAVVIASISVGVLAALVIVSRDVAAALYITGRVGLPVLFLALAALASVRVGIASVRRKLLEGLEPDTVLPSPNESVRSAPENAIRDFIMNPEHAVQRLDSWLRERLK